MGLSNSKLNMVIDVSYCGGCGWAKIAQKICESIRLEIPQAIIDCRPEDNYTGSL
jgi:hypothetical protein